MFDLCGLEPRKERSDSRRITHEEPGTASSASAKGSSTDVEWPSEEDDGFLENTHTRLFDALDLDLGMGSRRDEQQLLQERMLERASKASSTIESVERGGRIADNWVLKRYDGIRYVLVDSVLSSIGSAVTKTSNIEGAPQTVKDALAVFLDALWTAMRPTLRESLVGPVPGDYNAYLVRNWAERHPHLFGASSFRPLTFVRAHMMYALYPADRTFFMKLRSSPLYLVLMGLKLSTITGIPVFALQFYLIDRRDEYQVVNFILSFKTFQFMTGVLLAVLFLAPSFYSCLNELNDHDPDVAWDAAAMCNTLVSSSDELFPIMIALEVPRAALIFYALHLLQTGYTRGGIGELRALAEVRIDAADGTLDGFADVAAIALDGSKSAGRAHVMPTSLELDAAKEAARVRFRAQPGTGFYLPAFMKLDIVLVSVIMLYGGYCTASELIDGEMAMVWHTLYYLKIFYALSAFPFLVFLTPVFGKALHGAKPTGYDMAGLCVPLLGNANIRRKNALAQKRAAAAAQLAKEEESNAWARAWRRSSARRWIYGLLGLFPPVRLLSRAMVERSIMY